jgi:chromosome segregation ATPase
MTDVERLAERVDTIERAIGDGTHEFPAIEELSQLTDRIETIEKRLDRLEEQTTELDGATQALRGYVGNIRSVNERIEQRADAAMAATDRIERELKRRAENEQQRHERATESTVSGAESTSPDRTAHRNHTADGLDGMGSIDSTETPDNNVFDPTQTQGTRAVSDHDRTTEQQDPGVFERVRSLL